MSHQIISQYLPWILHLIYHFYNVSSYFHNFIQNELENCMDDGFCHATLLFHQKHCQSIDLLKDNYTEP